MGRTLEDLVKAVIDQDEAEMSATARADQEASQQREAVKTAMLTAHGKFFDAAADFNHRVAATGYKLQHADTATRGNERWARSFELVKAGSATRSARGDIRVMDTGEVVVVMSHRNGQDTNQEDVDMGNVVDLTKADWSEFLKSTFGITTGVV